MQAVERSTALVAPVVAWLVPGLGHIWLRRRVRGALFAALVLGSLAIGCGLEGNVYRIVPGQPLTVLATIASMGLGLPYFALRLFGYQGDVVSPGYEYGTAFVLTAALMNLLLVLDAWDLGRGVKE